MTEKRFILKSDYDWWGVVDTTGEIKGEYDECFSTDTVVDLLNALHEENQELILQLNQCSDQRNEFHRGARENANRVGKLEKENEQLKSENMMVTGANKILKENNKRLKEEIKDFQDLLAGKEEELLKPIIRMIDDRIAHYKHKPISAPISNPVNPKYDVDVDRLGRLSELQELKKELKGGDVE